jgi:hypothetical protein
LLLYLVKFPSGIPSPSRIDKEVKMKKVAWCLFAVLYPVALVPAAWARGIQAAGETAAARSGQDLLPDKFFEFSVPLLVVFLALDAVISLLKQRGEVQLKKTAIEKGVSEEGLARLFAASDGVARLQPLKWFLLALSVGLSFVLIHFLRSFLGAGSGYLVVGIVLVFAAGSFYAYYRILEVRVGRDPAERK